MEQALKSHVDAPSGFLLALRNWSNSFRGKRQHRRDIRRVSEFTDHILRDVGCEDLIRRRKIPGAYGL